MVRNHYSVISTGTEGKTVTDARKGYVAKARSRQKEVRQVIDMIKTNGLLPTYKLVMNKLEAPSSLGYSCAGEVIAVGEGVTKFQVGDFVACGGNTASHADVVSVPVNLAVKVSDKVNLKHAAFSTIAAISIQGIRQAELRLGENCLIIGMGIIGQLTYKILEASGIRPIGVDVSNGQIEHSKQAGINLVYNRNLAGIEDVILNHSMGYGVDAVIITAGTSSLDPVEFAGLMARKKAKVIIVGAVPTGFSRANYYKKELELRMSCSYGPGRSDMTYEEKGNDYPIGYVRWTENRNMQSYIDLLEAGKVNIEPLISHTFPLEEAPNAYDMILERKEPFAGVVIQYDEKRELSKAVILNKDIPKGKANVGFIGAGSFAQGSLLPNMKNHCNLVAVATASGNTAKYVGEKYSFNYCAESADEILKDTNIDTIFITTRHNLHAEYVLKGLEKFKHIFVEKPLAMDENQLEKIRSLYEEITTGGKAINIMVGFNRRFAPAVIEAKKLFLSEQPKSIVMRINSGIIPPEHWVNDPDIGGGRIIGEACHFIDLAMFLAGSKICSVSAENMRDPNHLNNTVCINLKMQNGSIASINYFANGNKSLPKEYIEIFCGGTVVQINDFRSVQVFGKKTQRIKFKGQDKGHSNGVQAFLKAIKNGEPCPIQFDDSYNSMLATFKTLQSMTENRKIEIK